MIENLIRKPNTAGAYGGKKAGKTIEELGYDCDAWSTPQPLFDDLNAVMQFTLDACADANNHKCPTYFDKETNGLIQSWAGHRVFCNPPYSVTGQWLQKAYDERDHAFTCALFKADTSTDWFQYHWELKDDHKWLKRIQFEPPPGYPKKVGSPNMGHVLFFYGVHTLGDYLEGFLEKYCEYQNR